MTTTFEFRLLNGSTVCYTLRDPARADNFDAHVSEVLDEVNEPGTTTVIWFKTPDGDIVRIPRHAILSVTSWERATPSEVDE